MMFRFFMGGLFALFFVSSSYAVNWDKELQDLVHNKNYARAIAQISGSKIADAYRYATSGNIAGKLIRFSVGGLFWSGALYISTELLNQYINTKLNSSSSSSSLVQVFNNVKVCKTNVNTTSYCPYGFNVNVATSLVISDVSTDITYTSQPCNTAYSDATSIGLSVYSEAGVYLYHTNIGGTSSYHLSKDLVSYIQNNIPSCGSGFYVGSSQYQTPEDVLNDPANYSEIADLITQSPAVFDDNTFVPSVDGGEVSDYEIKVPLGGGYTLVETPSGLQVLTPSGAYVPATKIGDKITFEDGNKKYTYDINSGNLTYVDNSTGEVSQTTEQTSSQTEVQNSDGTTSQIDWGTFTTPTSPDLPKLDTNIDVPEKKSLTDLVNTSFSSIPALNILKTLQIQGSGVCSFNIPFSIGSFSGSGVIDFCQFSNIFSIIGSFILAFAHLFAIYIVFKGD